MAFETYGTNTWAVTQRGSEWYWGKVPNTYDYPNKPLGSVVLSEVRQVHGPFDTAADAALDMVRTWALASAERGSTN